MQPRFSFVSLEMFRQILGLSILDFYGVSLISCGNQNQATCAEGWVRDSSQAHDNTMSWDNLLDAIIIAERDIQNFLGHPLGITWDCIQRAWPYPNSTQYNQATFMLDGWFVEAGQRADVLLATATNGVELTFTDIDGDGFPEQATITITDDAFIGLDTCEINFRYGSYYISNPRTITIVGNVLTATFYSFQLLKPSLFDGLFTPYPIDICATAPIDDNFVETVEVWRTYNNPLATQAQICSVGDNTNNCQPCTATDPCAPQCQEACIVPIGDGGIVKVIAADPDGAGGFTYLNNCGLTCPPSYVEMNFMINPCNQYGCSSTDCWGVCPELVNAVVALASARLIKTCVCRCSDGRIKWYQRELGRDNTLNTYDSQAVTFNVIEKSPFGTLWGEIYAYQSLAGLAQKSVGVVTI